MTPPSPPLAGETATDPQDAAVYWSARRRLGLASPDDETAFQAWLQTPAHRAAFEAVERPLEALGSALSHPDAGPMIAEARAFQAPRRRRPGGRAGPILIAAIAAGFGLLVLVPMADLQTFGPGFARPDGAQAGAGPAGGQRYSTATGGRRELTLADGSTVHLNTDSLIEVDYSQARRSVRLLRGQAMFDVAKHQDRPFVVIAGGREVVATGTAFDVRLLEGQVKVVLIEGRVTVAPTARRGLRRVLPVAKESLSPGQQLVAAPEGPSAVTRAELDRETSWRKGQVIFRDDRLAVAVAEMNRYSTQPLRIEDPRVADLKISGVFRTDQQANYEAALLAYFPLEVERRPDGSHLLRWKDGAGRGRPPSPG
ncbi:FecR domain-containing protein (plasmid) [Brevundimonas staleyi]|uniref:FecR family protein n=1 Tax=Brevundimonas staleyi TaxID=74326 RepID=A0ABW0FQI6_9CAUL